MSGAAGVNNASSPSQQDGAEYLRNWEKPNERTFVRPGGYKFPPGTTKLITRQVLTASAASLPLNEAVNITEGAPESMEVDVAA